MLKLLIVGDTTYKMYAYAFYKAASDIKNIEASIFDFGKLNIENTKNSIMARLEAHYKNGILTYCINRDLVNVCIQNRYDIVFLYSCSLIYADTIRRIKEYGIYIALFCNDNPFSEFYKNYTWKHLIASVQYTDIVYAYRISNIENYQQYGAKKVNILLPYYIKERNYYIPDDKIDLDVPEVVFIGHMENDRRNEYISRLLTEGIEVGLNQEWNKFEKNNPLIKRFSSNQKIYNEIINKAKIAIVFLSQINNDTYTRRCFEIPATKTMMIAPYTKDLAQMFEENKEIVFYRGIEDFVNKIRYYLDNEEERNTIANNAYNRLLKDEHEAKDRVCQVLDDYAEFVRG